MAALAPSAANVDQTVMGNMRVVLARLTAPANGDTWTVPGLSSIKHVDVTFNATPAAADSTGVTWAGNVITFNVIGTARNLSVKVIGN